MPNPRHHALHLLLDCLRSRREPTPRPYGMHPLHQLHPNNRFQRFLLYTPDGRVWDIDGVLVHETRYGSLSLLTKCVREIYIRHMTHGWTHSPPAVSQLSINRHVPIDIENFSFDAKYNQLTVTYYE